MSDLIKRQDVIDTMPTELNGITISRAIEVIELFLEEHECDELWSSVRALRDFVEWVSDEIKYISTVENAEIIRCKDCKHFQNNHICQYFSRFGMIKMKPDDYCSRANKDYGVGVQG